MMKLVGLGKSVAGVKEKVLVRIDRVVNGKYAQVVGEEEISDVWHLYLSLWYSSPPSSLTPPKFPQFLS